MEFKDSEYFKDEIDRVGYASIFGPKYLGSLLKDIVEKIEPDTFKYFGLYQYFSSNREIIKIGQTEYHLVKKMSDNIRLQLTQPLFTFSWLVDKENEEAFHKTCSRYVQRLRRDGHPRTLLFVSEQQFEDRPYIKECIQYIVNGVLHDPDNAKPSTLLDEFVESYKAKQKVLQPTTND